MGVLNGKRGRGLAASQTGCVCMGGGGVYLKVFEEEKGDAIAWISHTCMKTVYVTFVFCKLVIPLWSLGLHSLIFICMINIKSSTWLC